MGKWNFSNDEGGCCPFSDNKYSLGISIIYDMKCTVLKPITVNLFGLAYYSLHTTGLKKALYSFKKLIRGDAKV